MFCILIFIRILITDLYLLYTLLPSLTFNFQNKLDYLTLILLPAVFLKYVSLLLYEYKIKYIKFFYMSILCIISFVLLTKMDFDPNNNHDNPYLINFIYTYPNYRR